MPSSGFWKGHEGTPRVTEEIAVNGDQLSEVLRAQAAGLQAGSSDARATRPRPASSSQLPAWALLVLAVLLGTMAGGLAGIVSTW